MAKMRVLYRTQLMFNFHSKDVHLKGDAVAKIVTEHKDSK